MNIKINSEEEMVKSFRQLIHLTVNTRHWQIEWQENYGCELKLAKKRWEEKLDAFLLEMGAKYGGAKGNEGKEAINFEIINSNKQTT